LCLCKVHIFQFLMFNTKIVFLSFTHFFKQYLILLVSVICCGWWRPPRRTPTEWGKFLLLQDLLINKSCTNPKYQLPIKANCTKFVSYKITTQNFESKFFRGA
jgi:hypothetical protein